MSWFPRMCTVLCLCNFILVINWHISFILFSVVFNFSLFCYCFSAQHFIKFMMCTELQANGKWTKTKLNEKKNWKENQSDWKQKIRNSKQKQNELCIENSERNNKWKLQIRVHSILCSFFFCVCNLCEERDILRSCKCKVHKFEHLASMPSLLLLNYTNAFRLKIR